MLEQDIVEIVAPEQCYSFFRRKPRKLWYAGDPGILNDKLLGVISARTIGSDLALRTSELVRQLAFIKSVSFIGGWHSPLEEEALRLLLDQPVRVIFCLSKDLHRFVPSQAVKNGISTGRVLLLTHCSPKAKRISRDASLRRNLLVAGMSQGLLVLAASAGSQSLKLAKRAINLGHPVFAPQHRINEELLSYGALSATVDNIQQCFG